jgi:hypothetical protein
MKSPFDIVNDIISVLEPEMDATQTQMSVLQDEAGIYHATPGGDILEYILYQMLTGSAPCEPEGELSTVTLSELRGLTFCNKCAATPAMLLHAVADVALREAARHLHDLQVLRTFPDPARIATFVAERNGKEILAMAQTLMINEIGQRIRTGDIDLTEVGDYAPTISSIIARSFDGLDSIRSILGCELAGSKIRAYLETHAVCSTMSGNALVVLAGLQSAAVEAMQETDNETDVDERSTAETAVQLSLMWVPLVLQYLYAPGTRDETAAVILPAWVADVIVHMNPDQAVSPVVHGLTDIEADTARRLHTDDESSMYNDLVTCVQAAVALNTLSV